MRAIVGRKVFSNTYVSHANSFTKRVSRNQRFLLTPRFLICIRSAGGDWKLSFHRNEIPVLANNKYWRSKTPSEVVTTPSCGSTWKEFPLTPRYSQTLITAGNHRKFVPVCPRNSKTSHFCGGSQAWPTALDSGSSHIGVRGFKSLPPHFFTFRMQ